MKQARGSLLASVAGSLLYLGLAVLGRGWFAAFRSIPALTLVAVSTFGLVVVGLFSPVNLSPGEREDGDSRWALVVLMVIGFASAYLPAYTDRVGFWPLDGNVVRWFGVALFMAGGVLRLWPVIELRGQFSGLVAIQSDTSW